jgi:hypothetical protein
MQKCRHEQRKIERTDRRKEGKDRERGKKYMLHGGTVNVVNVVNVASSSFQYWMDAVNADQNDTTKCRLSHLLAIAFFWIGIADILDEVWAIAGISKSDGAHAFGRRSRGSRSRWG